MTKTRQDELRQRITEEIRTVEWIQRAAIPHGETLVGAAPQLTVLAAALAVHIGKLQEIRSLVV